MQEISLEMQTDAAAEKGRSWSRPLGQGPLKHHADPPSQIQIHISATSEMLSNTPSCQPKALEALAIASWRLRCVSRRVQPYICY